MGLGFSGTSTQTDVNKTEKGPKSTIFTIGAEVAKFEFKTGNHCAFTLNVGDIYYNVRSTKDSETSKTIENDFSMTLDPFNFGSEIGFKYYF